MIQMNQECPLGIHGILKLFQVAITGEMLTKFLIHTLALIVLIEIVQQLMGNQHLHKFMNTHKTYQKEKHGNQKLLELAKIKNQHMLLPTHMSVPIAFINIMMILINMQKMKDH